MKTADQVPNQSHHKQSARRSQLEYATAESILSNAAPQGEAAEDYHKIGEPIDAALWGWLEIPVHSAIEAMAAVINKHRNALIRALYLPLQNPKQRLCIGYGFLFAAGIHMLGLTKPGWRQDWQLPADGHAEFRPEDATLPGVLIIAGFDQEFYPFTFDSAQYALVFALLSQFDRLAKFTRALPPHDAAELAQAMHIAEKISTIYGALSERAFAIPKKPAEAFALEMQVRWMDAWCNVHLRDEAGRLARARAKAKNISAKGQR